MIVPKAKLVEEEIFESDTKFLANNWLPLLCATAFFLGMLGFVGRKRALKKLKKNAVIDSNLSELE